MNRRLGPCIREIKMWKLLKSVIHESLTLQRLKRLQYTICSCLSSGLSTTICLTRFVSSSYMEMQRMHWPLTSLSLTQSVDIMSVMFICMFDRASLGLCPSTVYACMNEDWTLLHTTREQKGNTQHHPTNHYKYWYIGITHCNWHAGMMADSLCYT